MAEMAWFIRSCAPCKVSMHTPRKWMCRHRAADIFHTLKYPINFLSLKNKSEIKLFAILGVRCACVSRRIASTYVFVRNVITWDFYFRFHIPFLATQSHLNGENALENTRVYLISHDVRAPFTLGWSFSISRSRSGSGDEVCTYVPISVPTRMCPSPSFYIYASLSATSRQGFLFRFPCSSSSCQSMRS